ncbi:MAG: hypothetical protein JKX99_03295 [Robiginitomaculum sp.]|nr:hypothetical protein [Robiginitomaculum sp.]
MRIFFIVVIFIGLISCTPTSTRDYSFIEGSALTVTVEKQDNGLWLAHYVFAEPQTAMILSRSRNDYRTQSWKSLDPNASFERINGFDAFLFENPTTNVSFEFKPYTGRIYQDYSPFIPFSDGGVAIYAGQFEALSVTDRAAIEELQGDIYNWQGQQGQLAVRILSAAPMIENGEIVTGEALDISTGGGGYIYVGNAKITEGKDFTGVIDPGLPNWLRERFDDDLTLIFDGFRELWGASLAQKSTVLFSFRGYQGQGFSNKGGVFGSMLTLDMSGSALRTEDKGTLHATHWFFAHEAAHLFQGIGGLHPSPSHHAWISEGGANALANHVLTHQNLVDEAYIVSDYSRKYAQCTAYLQTGKLSNASAQGKFEVPYACGDIMAQITDGALQDHSLFDFWNAMPTHAGDETGYSTDLYFDTMRILGAPQSIILGLQKIAHEQLDDPATLLTELMEQSGLAPKFDNTGKLIALKLP